MVHVIYISVIILLLWWIIRAYYLYNKKHKELLKHKEVNKVPYDILSNYEKGYVKFYRWMIDNNVDSSVVEVYEKFFNIYDN